MEVRCGPLLSKRLLWPSADAKVLAEKRSYSSANTLCRAIAARSFAFFLRKSAGAAGNFFSHQDFRVFRKKLLDDLFGNMAFFFALPFLSQSLLQPNKI